MKAKNLLEEMHEKYRHVKINGDCECIVLIHPTAYEAIKNHLNTTIAGYNIKDGKMTYNGHRVLRSMDLGKHEIIIIPKRKDEDYE
jgi:hypothetical protein